MATIRLSGNFDTDFLDLGMAAGSSPLDPETGRLVANTNTDWSATGFSALATIEQTAGGSQIVTAFEYSFAPEDMPEDAKTFQISGISIPVEEFNKMSNAALLDFQNFLTTHSFLEGGTVSPGLSVFGGAGADTFTLFGDDDLLSGNDIFRMGRGNDFAYGMDGNDTLIGGRGDDELIGGEGHDRLNGGSGDDTLSAGAGDDLLKGKTGSDILLSSTGSDTLYGGKGNDVLAVQSYAGSGDHILHGGRGRDFLWGGEGGDDMLTGGFGADTFFFDDGMGDDTITDFNLARDTLWLHPDLGITAGGLAEVAQTKDGSTVLDFGSGGSITLAGVTDLEALASSTMTGNGGSAVSFWEPSVYFLF